MTVLLLPGVVAVVVSIGAAAVHHRLRPSAAAPVLALVSAATALAVVWSLILLAIGFLAHVAWLADLAVWCRTVGFAHDAVPPAAGAASIVLLVAMASSLIRTGFRFRRQAVGASCEREVMVLPTPEPTAYAVPGRPGHIVVSVGMLRALDDDERRVLLAHERAHLRHRHHRYLRLAELSASAVPLLKPLAARVRFATERWADEEAASEVGDRRLVARAVARAALVSAAYPAPALAFGGYGVPARVTAMLTERPPQMSVTISLASAAGVALFTVAASTIQLHHLLAFASEVCRTA